MVVATSGAEAELEFKSRSPVSLAVWRFDICFFPTVVV